jgi:hypothetical protein
MIDASELIAMTGFGGAQAFPVSDRERQADVAEATVGEPAVVRGIAKHRIDTLQSSTPSDDGRTASSPRSLVTWARLPDEQADGRLGLRARGGIVKEIAVTARMMSGAHVLLPPRSGTSGPGAPAQPA